MPHVYSKAKNGGFWLMRLKLLLLIGFSTIPLYILILSIYFGQVRSARRAAFTETTQLVSIAASTQEGLLDATQQYLETLSQVPEVLPENADECNQLLKEVWQNQQQRYTNVGVIDLEGNVYCNSLEIPSNVNASDRLYFRKAIENKGFSIGEYQIGRISGKPSINFGYPVLDDEGEPVAVVFAGLDLAWLNRLAESVNLPEGAVINLLDTKGVVLVRHPSQGEWVGKNVLETQLFSQISSVADEEGTFEAVGLDEIQRLYAYDRFFDDSGSVYLMVGFPSQLITANANRTLMANLTVLVGFTVVGLGVAAFVSERLIIIPAKKLAQAEAQIKEQAARDAAILENIGDGLIVTNSTGVITLVNEAASNMLKKGVSSFLGQKVVTSLKMLDEKGGLVPSSERPMQIALQSGHEVKGIYTYQLENNQAIVVAVTVTPILVDGQITGSIQVFRDVSKEKEVDRMKSEFISLASHQLKTPLTAMRWYSELLLDDQAGGLNKTQREYVTTIHTANQHMGDLVNTLLNISRIESGRLMISPQDTDIAKLVTEIISEVKPKLSEKKQKLELTIDRNIPSMLVDPSLLRQIYLNLLTNASKYSPEKTVIKLDLAVDDGQLVSSVTDSGYGIPKAEQHRVFQKFYRGENIIKKESSEGTGLGLYLIKMIIDSFGGTISFKSKVNQGTTFKFTVPLSGMKSKTGEVGLS